MTPLPETSRRLLAALIDAPIAWQSPLDLARALRAPESETLDRLAELEAEGWLAVWERDDGLVVTLSTLGAERLGVRIVEYGAALTPRWLPLGEPEPPAPRARRVVSETRSADWKFLADPRAEGRDDGVSDAADDLPERRRGPIPRWLRPTLLIGEGLTPWPGPDPPPAKRPNAPNHDPTVRPCPSCHDRRLPRHAYCLRCDRWGLDTDPHATSTRRPEPKSFEVADRRAAARLRATLEQRKQRRRARLSGTGNRYRSRHDPRREDRRRPSACGSAADWPTGRPESAGSRDRTQDENPQANVRARGPETSPG